VAKYSLYLKIVTTPLIFAPYGKYNNDVLTAIRDGIGLVKWPYTGYMGVILIEILLLGKNLSPTIISVMQHGIFKIFFN
jgi:hypothetical protein